MILSWLIVLAWIAVAAVAGVIAWFVTDQIARRVVRDGPAEAPSPRPRRVRR